MNTTKWVSDPTHSELQFKVKHMMITTVTGHFSNFSVEVESDSTDFSSAKIAVKGDVNSISSNNEQRDNHLKSADFFDAEKFAALEFNADKFNATSGKVSGNLTIKGISKPVELDVEFAGTNKDPWGNEKAGFTISGKINRKDWGLNWNAALETGGMLVSEDVRIHAEVQLVKQA